LRPFSVSHAVPSGSRLGVHKKLGGDTARTADPSDIPYHITSCSAIKAGVKKEERGGRKRSELWCLSSQVTTTGDGALLSWKWLNTCLSTERAN